MASLAASWSVRPENAYRAERTEQEREHKGIARKLFEMPLGSGQGHFRLPLDCRGHDLDVLAFALARRGGQPSGVRRLGACFGDFHIHLMDAGSRNVSEREGRIFDNGAVESLPGPVPGRKNTIDTVAVKCRRAV